MPKREKITGPVIETAQSQYQHWSDNGGVPTTYLINDGGPADFAVRNYLSYMEGWSIPGWKKMKNEGLLLPYTPFKHYQYEAKHDMNGQFEVMWVSNGKLYQYSNPDPYLLGTYTWFSKAGVPGHATLIDQIGEPDPSFYVQKAAAQIASHGWDVLTFLAELHHLRAQFSDIVTKLRRLVNPKYPARELARLWLEGRYAWRTLLYDVRDLHDAVTTWDEKRSRYSQRSGYTYTDNWMNSGNPTYGNCSFSWSEHLSAKISLRGSVIADIYVPKLQFNPVATAWEVTRLSFVVDWLINVGQAIDASTFLLLAKDYQAAAGYRIDFDVEGSCVPGSALNGAAIYAFGSTWHGSGFYEYRVPSTVSALPRLKLRLDKLKVWDSLALIYQAVNSKRRK